MRLLTALLVIGLCGFATIRGWSIVQFEEQRASLASNSGEIAGIAQWVGVPGLTGVALGTSLMQTANESDLDRMRVRAESQSALLSVRPLSSEGWLSFAGMQLATGQSYQRILAALQMSSMTGPNEGTIMWRRGILGLLLWHALAPDVRERSISDLAGAILGTSVADGEMRVAKAVLDAKSAEVRSQILDLLRADGVPKVKLDRMGL